MSLTTVTRMLDGVHYEVVLDNNEAEVLRESIRSNCGLQLQPQNTVANNQQSSMHQRIDLEFKKRFFVVNQDEQPDEVFEELDILGIGNSGNVLKMRHKKTGTICAVKQMRRTSDDKENKRIYMDLQVLSECKCDNIVECYGYFIKEAEVWICMEPMATCFAQLLKSRKSPLPEKVLGALARSAVKALHYLKEEHNIIHRDVKPSNILINDRGQIKLCDFGISGRLENSLQESTVVGCIPYMAPERFDRVLPSNDVRTDVWSLGMTLYELATGRLPYLECDTDFQLITRIIKDDSPSLPADMEFSREFRDFISACLTKDYKRRPKYRQLIDHEFLVMHKDTVVTLSEI